MTKKEDDPAPPATPASTSAETPDAPPATPRRKLSLQFGPTPSPPGSRLKSGRK